MARKSNWSLDDKGTAACFLSLAPHSYCRVNFNEKRPAGRKLGTHFSKVSQSHVKLLRS